MREPGAAAYTKATYVIEDRVPGVRQTYLRPVDPALRLRTEMTVRGDRPPETERP